MTGPQDVEQEFRPSLRTHLRTLRTAGRLFVFTLAGFSLALNLADWDAGPALLALGCCVLVLGLPPVLWRLVARLRITDRAVHRRDALGRTRVVPRDGIAQALLVPRFHAPGDPATGLLVLLDRQHRALLRLDGLWWGADRLRPIADAVGAPLTVIEDQLTPGELVWRRVYELSWRERHPVLTEAVTVVGVVLALVAVFVLFEDAQGWDRGRRPPRGRCGTPGTPSPSPPPATACVPAHPS